jgi:hypothetical protein
MILDFFGRHRVGQHSEGFGGAGDDLFIQIGNKSIPFPEEMETYYVVYGIYSSNQ